MHTRLLTRPSRGFESPYSITLYSYSYPTLPAAGAAGEVWRSRASKVLRWASFLLLWVLFFGFLFLDPLYRAGAAVGAARLMRGLTEYMLSVPLIIVFY